MFSVAWAVAASVALAPAAALACDQIGIPRARVETDTTIACFEVGVRADEEASVYSREWSTTLTNACLDACTATIEAGGETSNIEIPSGANTSLEVGRYERNLVTLECAGSEAGDALVLAYETYEGGCGPFGCAAASGGDATDWPLVLGVLLAAFGVRRQFRGSAS